MQLLKKFEMLIEYLLGILKEYYYRKFRVTNLLFIALALYVMYKYMRYEKQLSPQTFVELLKMHSF